MTNVNIKSQLRNLKSDILFDAVKKTIINTYLNYKILQNLLYNLPVLVKAFVKRVTI